MGHEEHPRGQLIALEGAGGQDLTAAAKRLLRQFSEKGHPGRISEWGASKLFAELDLADPSIPGPSPRTLVLLYASDLAFRLRWEIRPALEEGRAVIAAPYVQTAIGFGKATGLSRRWLVELFCFAPRPAACYCLHERRPWPASGQQHEGYLELCYDTLGHSSPPWDPDALREDFDRYLHALVRRRGCQPVTEKLPAAVGSDRS